MTKILIVLPYYLPGYKAGGPIRTIAGLTEWLEDEFQFYIVTADRDLGDHEPYSGIRPGTWRESGKASVLYLSPQMMTLRSWYRHLSAVKYDLLYLNSFFAPSTRGILLLRRLNLVPRKPVILAPCGEFSQGAFRLKGLKKQAYTHLVKWAGLCRGIIWRASSEYEKRDILAIFDGRDSKSSPTVRVAPDLPPKQLQTHPELRPAKPVNSARLVFLSRITRMKNLDFALNLLSSWEGGNIEFDIYGPVEDTGYWKECETLIGKLPANVRVEYRGEVDPQQVGDVFSRYHLFLFPTRGENYGHVVLESLRAGCPVLISDQTMWRHLCEKQVGWDIPLDKPDHFRDALSELVEMDNETFGQWSLAAEEYGNRQAQDALAVRANRDLLLQGGI